jgi:hypothetical protein
MAASPDPSLLPPRGPRDLGTLGSTSQDRQSEKQLNFFATNRHMKHLNLAFNEANALLTMYIVNITLQKQKKMLLLLFWWSGGASPPCRSGTAPDAGRHHVRCDTLGVK